MDAISELLNKIDARLSSLEQAVLIEKPAEQQPVPLSNTIEQKPADVQKTVLSFSLNSTCERSHIMYGFNPISAALFNQLKEATGEEFLSVDDVKELLDCENRYRVYRLLSHSEKIAGVKLYESNRLWIAKSSVLAYIDYLIKANDKPRHFNKSKSGKAPRLFKWVYSNSKPLNTVIVQLVENHKKQRLQP